MLMSRVGSITKLSPNLASMTFGQKATAVRQLIADHGTKSCIMFGKTY